MPKHSTINSDNVALNIQEPERGSNFVNEREQAIQALDQFDSDRCENELAALPFPNECRTAPSRQRPWVIEEDGHKPLIIESSSLTPTVIAQLHEQADKEKLAQEGSAKPRGIRKVAQCLKSFLSRGRRQSSQSGGTTAARPGLNEMPDDKDIKLGVRLLEEDGSDIGHEELVMPEDSVSDTDSEYFVTRPGESFISSS